MAFFVEFIRCHCVGGESLIGDDAVPEKAVQIVGQTGPGHDQTCSGKQSRSDEKEEVVMIVHVLENEQIETEGNGE